MNADGSDVRRLTTDSAIGYFNPQFSPDGKRIVYYAEKGDSKDQIWVMNVDGSNQTLLTNNLGHNIYPGWSPNGKEIIFASSKREGKTDGSYIDGSYLYVMNADGSNLRKLGNLRASLLAILQTASTSPMCPGSFRRQISLLQTRTGPSHGR